MSWNGQNNVDIKEHYKKNHYKRPHEAALSVFNQNPRELHRDGKINSTAYIWLYIALGFGLAVLVLIIFGIFCDILRRRRREQERYNNNNSNPTRIHPNAWQMRGSLDPGSITTMSSIQPGQPMNEKEKEAYNNQSQHQHLHHHMPNLQLPGNDGGNYGRKGMNFGGYNLAQHQRQLYNNNNDEVDYNKKGAWMNMNNQSFDIESIDSKALIYPSTKVEESFGYHEDFAMIDDEEGDDKLGQTNKTFNKVNEIRRKSSFSTEGEIKKMSYSSYLHLTPEINRIDSVDEGG